MKRTILALTLVIATCSFSFGAALSNNTASSPGAKVYGTPNATNAVPVLLGALSKSVLVIINLSANNAGQNAGAEADSYALMTYHLNGSKAYGSAAQDTKMYNTDKTSSGWPSLSATDSTSFSSWTSM